MATAAASGVDGLLPRPLASSTCVGIGRASGAGLTQNPGPANTVELGLPARGWCLLLVLELRAALAGAGLGLDVLRARCPLLLSLPSPEEHVSA